MIGLEDVGMMLIGGAIMIIIIAAVIWGITTVVRTICKTIVLNTKIKYFGTSQEYEDFKAWKKMQTEDMTEL